MSAINASSTGLNELANGNSSSVINRPQPGIAPAVAGEPLAVSTAAADPFGDIAGLRLSQDFDSGLALAKPLLTVPVRKPSKEWFVRVHPSPDYRLQPAVIELKEDSELYMVDRSLWSELASENTFGPRVLFTCYSRPGNVVFLWPVHIVVSFVRTVFCLGGCRGFRLDT